MLLPSFYYYLAGKKAQKSILDSVQRMWLMKNGDQVVLETADGVMHKANIVHNTEHAIQSKKN